MLTSRRPVAMGRFGSVPGELGQSWQGVGLGNAQEAPIQAPVPLGRRDGAARL